MKYSESVRIYNLNCCIMKLNEVDNLEILAFWILIGGFIIGGFVQILFALSDNDELTFKTAFWYATAEFPCLELLRALQAVIDGEN